MMLPLGSGRHQRASCGAPAMTSRAYQVERRLYFFVSISSSLFLRGGGGRLPTSARRQGAQEGLHHAIDVARILGVEIELLARVPQDAPVMGRDERHRDVELVTRKHLVLVLDVA